ncbi:MAG TPA: hypothetical protein VIL24_00225 [Clostridia bacterium]
MKNWLGRLGSFFLGIIFGIIVTLGGIIGVGLWGYKNLSINKVKELTRQDWAFLNAFLEQNAALKDMSIEQIVLSVASIPNKTLDEIAAEYGIIYPANLSFLINALEGVQINQIGASLSNIVGGLKIGNFLGAPYNDFDTYPPDYEGEPPQNISPLLWSIRNYSINEVSTKITEEIKIGQLLGAPYDNFENTSSTPPEGASSFIWAIRGYTINSMSENVTNEIKIGSLLGAPYSNYDDYPETYQGALPEGADSLLWSIRYYTVNTMSDKLLNEVKVGNILGEPYSDFETYPEDYEGALPEGAEALLWDLRTFTIKGENGIGKYPDTLTVGDLKTVFNVTLPDILKVEDSAPLKNLGDEINNLYIHQIIDPPKEESDIITKNIINKLRFLKKDGSVQNPADEPIGESDWYRLSEINDLMNALPSALTTKDIMEDPSTQGGMDKISKVIMQKIYDGNFKVTELSQKISQTLGSTYIHELIDEPGEEDDYVTKNLVNKLRTLTHKNGEGEDVYYSLSEINELLKALPASLTIQSILQEPQEGGMANAILRKVWETDAKLTELQTKLTEVFENLTFADILEEPANADSVSGRIINKLRATNSGGSHWKVTQIESAINSFTFGDLYPDQSSGILSLVAPETPLDQVPSAIQDVFNDTTLGELYDKGIISVEPASEQIAQLKLNDVINFINQYYDLMASQD